jgi:predicted ATPase
MSVQAPDRGFDRFFVVTGGPGSGKSTLLAALGASGLATTEEAGRRVIQDQSLIGGEALPWRDPLLFAEMMLTLDMRSHHAAAAAEGPVLFDRGVPDIIGYLGLVGRPVPDHMSRAAAAFRYNETVFVAPHWPEIYRNDAERRQDPAEAERTHAAMVAVYGRLGYRLVELPRAPVAERVAFVRSTITRA